jgi:TonB family protein
MNRLEKKCFIGSAMFHGFLLIIVLFGSAFLSSKKYEDIGPVVEIKNAIPTDKPFNTGGNPNGNPTPPPPQPQPQPPPPKPVDPVKPPPEPVKRKEPDIKPVTREKPDSPKETVKDTTTKPLVPMKVVKRTNDAALQMAKAEQAKRDKERREYQDALNRYNEQRSQLSKEIGGIVGSVGKGLSHSTVVEPLGPGGAAFVNYGSLVREIYDRAWRVSDGMTDDDSKAIARVTIRRDGSVASAAISRRSGNSALDRSVQSALDTVRDIGKPFPEGAKEAERTFTIEFNLRTKRAIG